MRLRRVVGRQLVLSLLAAAVVAVVVVFAMTAPGASDAEWGGARVVAGAAEPTSLRLGSGARGEIVAVWLAREGGGVAPYAATREPGRWFEAARRIAEPGQLSDLQLAVNRQGHAIAASGSR
jgi:hypothetical protein